MVVQALSDLRALFGGRTWRPRPPAAPAPATVPARSTLSPSKAVAAAATPTNKGGRLPLGYRPNTTHLPLATTGNCAATAGYLVVAAPHYP